MSKLNDKYVETRGFTRWPAKHAPSIFSGRVSAIPLRSWVCRVSLVTPRAAHQRRKPPSSLLARVLP